MADKSIEVRVADIAESNLKAARDSLRKRFGEGVPLGHETVDDETFAAFVELKMVEFPPVPITDELTGQVVEASPWFAALGFVEGGKAVQDRYGRIRGLKQEAS